MLELVFAQVSGETDTAVELFVQVFQPDPRKDVEAFKTELRGVLSIADDAGGIADNRITEGLVDGMRLGAKYNTQAQSELFMVIGNLTIVEGIVNRYAPELDPNEEVKTIMGAILRRRLFGPRMQEEMRQHGSATLGEVLRSEDVLQPRPTGPHPAGYVVVALLGIIVGPLIGMALSGYSRRRSISSMFAAS